MGTVRPPEIRPVKALRNQLIVPQLMVETYLSRSSSVCVEDQTKFQIQ